MIVCCGGKTESVRLCHFMYVCVNMCVCMCVCVCMYDVWMDVCMYMCACIYVCSALYVWVLFRLTPSFSGHKVISILPAAGEKK